jgi:anthranilate 1,2-dioxygenase ferredoxin subunit
MPYCPALLEKDLPEGGTFATVMEELPVLICRIDGAVFAVINRCTHAASTLDGGRIRRGSISCPLHGARFDLKTGASIGGLYAPLQTFATRLAGATIEVEIPDAPTGEALRPIGV